MVRVVCPAFSGASLRCTPVFNRTFTASKLANWLDSYRANQPGVGPKQDELKVSISSQSIYRKETQNDYNEIKN